MTGVLLSGPLPFRFPNQFVTAASVDHFLKAGRRPTQAHAQIRRLIKREGELEAAIKPTRYCAHGVRSRISGGFWPPEIDERTRWRDSPFTLKIVNNPCRRASLDWADEGVCPPRVVLAVAPRRFLR